MEANDRLSHRTDRADKRNQEILIEMVDVLGKKWQPVILYQLSRDGDLGFTDLRARVSGITNKMLSDGLNTLEDEGLVDRRIVNNKPVRVRYSLTERGEAMAEVVETMLRWGCQYLDGENASQSPKRPDSSPTAESGKSGRI